MSNDELEQSNKVDAEELLVGFLEIVYSEKPSLAFEAFAKKWSPTHSPFVTYVRTQWMSNVAHWAQAFYHENNQGIRTNNLVETYHHQLKYGYLPPNSRARPDDLVHMLVAELEPDLKADTMAVLWNFKPQITNKAQRNARAIADSYSLESLHLLGIRVQKNEHYFFVDSFTNPPARTYRLKYVKGGAHTKASVSNCNCLNFCKGKLACKHMYLVARLEKIKIIEDPSSIYHVTWLSGPYGNVAPRFDSTRDYRRGRGESGTGLAWPTGLSPLIESTDGPVRVVQEIPSTGNGHAMALQAPPCISNPTLNSDLANAQPFAGLGAAFQQWEAERLAAQDNDGGLDFSQVQSQVVWNDEYETIRQNASNHITPSPVQPGPSTSSAQDGFSTLSYSHGAGRLTAAEQTAFAKPLVNSTFAAVDRLKKMNTAAQRKRLIEKAEPAHLERIKAKAAELERAIKDSLSSGRPRKQPKH